MDEIIDKLVKKFNTNDPFIIADGLNILIRYADFEDGTRGLYYRKLRRRFIVIHNELDDHWKRVVCAHELAHDRLHPDLSRFWLDDYSFFNAGKYEKQANKFALKLLTHSEQQQPEEPIEHFLHRCGIPQELHSFYD